MVTEVRTINLNIINKKFETLFAGHVSQLNITTQWLSDGRKIPFLGRNGKKTERIRECDIKITKLEYDVAYNANATITTSHEEWTLEVNGEKIPGDVTSYSGTYGNMKVRLCMGEN